MRQQRMLSQVPSGEGGSSRRQWTAYRPQARSTCTMRGRACCTRWVSVGVWKVNACAKVCRCGRLRECHVTKKWFRLWSRMEHHCLLTCRTWTQHRRGHMLLLEVQAALRQRLTPIYC